MVMMDRLVVGCMSGTSLDAIDAALVRIEGNGLEMQPTLVRGASYPLQSLGEMLRSLADQESCSPREYAEVAHLLGVAHAVLIEKLLAEDSADLIAVHGQTIYHAPPLSLQMINPHPIVQTLKTAVVYDLRAADLAHGGQGAPITPLADHILYRDAEETRAVVNLGGFANFTWLSPCRQQGHDALTSIRGGDICACNQLLDHLARTLLEEPFDDNGQHAAKGKVLDGPGAELRDILLGQSKAGRSLGTGDEAIEWVDSLSEDYASEDLLRTACHVIAKTVIGGLGDCDRVILAGGGACNQTLVQELRLSSIAELSSSSDFCVPGQYREAVAIAVLAALSQDRIPITLPQITGVVPPSPVAGVWIKP